jgi:hypothetical protein
MGHRNSILCGGYMKRFIGRVLIVIGGLMILSLLNLVATKYDFHSQHDLSKGAGGTGWLFLFSFWGSN